MKKIKLEEEFEQQFDSFFNETDFSNQQISVFQNESALKNVTNPQKEEFLDKFLSAIKFIFIYVPGAMLMNMVGMFIKVFILYGANFPNLFLELLGAALIGTFLMMMGISKLSNLRYLKVPLAVLAMSFLLALIHSVIWIFDGGKTEGVYWLVSFPLVIVWGYIVKRFLDKE